MPETIKYKSGYKYQLVDSYSLVIEIRPDRDIYLPFLSLTKEGGLIIREGYAWDGPSGPAVDTKNFMRGSLVHDALYQMMQGYFLPVSNRIAADRLLQEICIEDGMSRLRAWWVYVGVRLGAGPYASATGQRPVIEAP